MPALTQTSLVLAPNITCILSHLTSGSQILISFGLVTGIHENSGWMKRLQQALRQVQTSGGSTSGCGWRVNLRPLFSNHMCGTNRTTSDQTSRNTRNLHCRNSCRILTHHERLAALHLCKHIGFPQAEVCTICVEWFAVSDYCDDFFHITDM